MFHEKLPKPSGVYELGVAEQQLKIALIVAGARSALQDRIIRKEEAAAGGERKINNISEATES
jgi:hypothetical protein